MEPTEELNYLFIGIEFTLTGMIVVFAGLMILFVMMTLFQHLDVKMTEARERKQRRLLKRKGGQAAGVDTSPASDAIAPEVMAVIAAAVTTELGKKVHVRRVRYRATEATTWSRQGRISIMASRIIRR